MRLYHKTTTAPKWVSQRNYSLILVQGDFPSHGSAV